MEDPSPSSSTLPTTKLPKRAFPSLKINCHYGKNILMELRKTLFSPISLIKSPSFRTPRSMALVGSFAFIFILCTMVLFFGNSHIHGHSSLWLKNVLKKRSQFHTYFPHYLFHDNPSKIPQNPGVLSVDHETKDIGINGNEKEIKAGLNNRVLPKRNGKKSWLKMMGKCDIFDGKWVKDDSGPLYEPGSCPLMDESFNCYQNGRPDNGYEKFRWQPNHCNIPRKILKFLKGKRIVYVGDSLNRNMWESMVCLLRNSVKNKSRVFEASGKSEFKKEGTYSFLFTDYNFSAEYIRSAFLVQEWEMPINNGSKKETLRLDMVETSYDTYKDADVLVFNTGNWWTHEKTSQGKGYYQEGNHVHEKLDVVEAFDKAMTTWARWIEANINPSKTSVFFRGYSFSHFSKGEWNTGGRCDSKEPIEDEKDLLSLSELSPPIPQMLDKAMERVKTPVFYLNVTKMTNYRRDAHPSLYRKPNMTQEEKRVFLDQQDCSHWCLPGVPDTWNQLLFAQLLLSDKQRQLKQKIYNKTGISVN